MMLNRLKTIQPNYAFLCALAYLIKTLVMPASFADSAIVTCLFGLVAFQKYIELKTPKVTGIDIMREELKKYQEETRQHLVEVAVVARDAKKLGESISAKYNFNESVSKPQVVGNKRLF